MEDYKEKYEQLIKRIKHFHETVSPDWKRIIENHVPELKESDDEKIKKAIIESLPNYGYLPQTSIKVDDAITWLEKQRKIIDEYEDKLDRCACESFDKGYKAAIEQAKKELKVCGNLDCDAARLIFRLFPELKEDEDEKIRKEIMDFVVDNTIFKDGRREKYLSWLEKQKTTEAALRYLKENHSPSEMSDFQVAMNIAVAKAYNKGYTDGFEKQGEQKLLNDDKYQTVPVKILDRLYESEKELEQFKKSNPYSGISFEYNGHTWGMCARDNGVDILLDKQLFKHLEKQGELIDEEELLIGAKKRIALSIMDFLDMNTLGMCLSSMECKGLEDAIVGSDWRAVYNYMKKKLEKQSTEDKYTFSSVVDKISPELKESDNEKIKKAIIESLPNYGYLPQTSIKVDDAITWLEKQHKIIDEYEDKLDRCACESFDKGYKAALEKQDEQPNKVSIWKHWNNGSIGGNGDGKLIYLVKSGNTYSLSSCLGFECDYIELSELDKLYVEQQGEQKPADKGEPESYFYCKYGGTIPLCSDCKRNHINSPFKREEITTWYRPSKSTAARECEDYIACFEKQSEQSYEKIEPRFKAGDVVIWDGEEYTIEKVRENTYRVGGYDCPIYTQDEFILKPPTKFNVGDFIVSDYCMGKVIELTDDAYLLDTGQGIPFSCEHNAHLWTINDAKDGDVLVASDGSIFLFAGVDNCACKYYAVLTNDNNIKINKEVKCGYWETSRAVYPATKEQRESLFQKMKEEGYEWDGEKKELRKIAMKEE